MSHCTLCPIACGADRQLHTGVCGVKGLTVAKYYLHPFEEPPISFRKGSGTVFFGGCHLRCAFCQNYDVSRAKLGREVTPKELTEIFKELEDLGADNVNLVTPDHVSDLIAEALELYKPSIPVVYNTSGYSKLDALERIAPYIDIWLPDLKFFSPTLSERYTGRKDYFEYASKAIEYMAKKPVLFSEEGKMLSGTIVRHLVMPMGTSDSMKLLDFLYGVSPELHISLMRQYVPMGESEKFPELGRKLTSREYRRVVDYATLLGFENVYLQDKESAEKDFIPDWNVPSPEKNS